jgi:malonate-semialdehyde dehydrogenase (acetylating)/methylmalonate-semialdehyde dehydrogenase
VLPDADLELAADAAVSAAFGSAGQRCMAISALVTVGDVAERLLPRIQERMHKLKVAPGTEPGADMGPLVTREHHARVRGYVDKGEAEGATLIEDGRTLKVAGGDNGYSRADDVRPRPPSMTIYQDESSGPCSRSSGPGPTKALTLVSENRYANGVAIFTNDGGAARKFQNEVQVGMVGINVPIPVPMAYYSFGGWKQSLFGDSHVHGREGVHFYTRGKVITSRWPDPKHRGVNLGFPQMK